MEPAPPRSLADSLAAAQGWWREAGVDLAFHDEPRGWLAPLAEPEEASGSPEPAAAMAEAPRMGGDPASRPRDLAAFPGWWLVEPTLGDGPSRARVPPRGPADASLMIVVPMPEPDDTDTLLAGPEGRLLANMTRAMALAPGDFYVAAALPRHVPLPDWGALSATGLGEVLRLHIELARPKRLLVLGNDVLSLLAHGLTQVAPAVSELSIQSSKLPLLSSYAPGRLLDHPRLRAELWRRWLEWTGTDA